MSPLDISLADLTNHLDEEHPDANGLARIGEAKVRAQTLSDLGEQLIGHYVGEAKQGGASWSEIGGVIGVSKQAAQQRHGAAALEGFTRNNRTLLLLSEGIARMYKHQLVGTEHILGALLADERCLAHKILMAKTKSKDPVRDAIERVRPPEGKKSPRPKQIRFGPESKEAIEQAIQASAELGCEWVDTEHTLLGLIRAEDSLAAQILRSLGFTSDELLEAVKTAAAR